MKTETFIAFCKYKLTTQKLLTRMVCLIKPENKILSVNEGHLSKYIIKYV